MVQNLTVTVVDDPETIAVTVSDSGVPSGGATGQVLAKFSGDDGAYYWADPSVLAGSATYFTTIDDLLIAPAASWADARTFSSYGVPVYAGWDRVLKTLPIAASLVANGDSVLETSDGLAFAIRRFATPIV